MPTDFQLKLLVQLCGGQFKIKELEQSSEAIELSFLGNVLLRLFFCRWLELRGITEVIEDVSERNAVPVDEEAAVLVGSADAVR